MVRIGLVQASAGMDIDANVKRNIHLIREALAKGAEIVCLQELFYSPYFPQYHGIEASKYAQEVPGPLTREISCIARESGAAIVVPFSKGEKRCPLQFGCDRRSGRKAGTGLPEDPCPL